MRKEVGDCAAERVKKGLHRGRVGEESFMCSFVVVFVGAIFSFKKTFFRVYI